MDIQEKKVAIIGLGIEGVALCDFLEDKAKSVFVLEKTPLEQILLKVDSDLKEKILKVIKSEKITFVFGERYLDNLYNFDIIYRSPSFYFDDDALVEAKRRGILVSSQIQLFFDLCPCKIIGVTGTKGKGTTASLIYEILSHNYQLTNNVSERTVEVHLAGNIGYPAINLIPELTKKDIVVLELSNFQLADLSSSPDIAVITNLYVDHLDYHKSVLEYHEAKFNILSHQKKSDLAILNHDSTFDVDNLEKISSEIRYFGHNNEAAIVLKDRVVLDPDHRKIEICKRSEINLFGEHNLENIAAATLVADSLGISPEIISRVVKSFVGLPHRIEFVAKINDVTFINDSFATNPEPTIAAIKSFEANKILILGGSAKGSDFDKLAQQIVANNIKVVCLIGVEAFKIKQSLLGAAEFKGEIVEGATNIDEVVLQAYQRATKDDVVIFSPACASFDMFRNYKDRGENFKAAVLQLKNSLNHQ
ncbi:MAG: UDP-N-acetylmuramoyl-L-alanine--D-glutamate ligase [bacterium]